MISAAPSGATTTYRATATFPSSLLSSIPLARLHFSVAVSAATLPPVTTFPSLTTKWQQIGANDVQAVTTSPLVPGTNYLVNVPTTINCYHGCASTARTERTISSQ